MRFTGFLLPAAFLLFNQLSACSQNIDTADKIKQVETNLVANIQAEGDAPSTIKDRSFIVEGASPSAWILATRFVSTCFILSAVSIFCEQALSWLNKRNAAGSKKPVNLIEAMVVGYYQLR